MRLVLLALVLASSIGCGPGNRLADAPSGSEPPAVDVPPKLADACVGLQCQVVQCEAMGRPTTSVSGTVYAPNGTLPLFGVTVYVPNMDPGPLPEGVQCTQCTDQLPGTSVTRATTNELGRFTVTNVPVGTDIPLVVTIGKWRRRLVIPTVTECTDNPIDPLLTRLPKNKTEGDIPKIAMATGNCDALECLMRKIGIDDSEFTTDAGNGRVHMFAGSGGASRFVDNTAFAAAGTLWNDLAKLKTYDQVLFSCECSQQASGKPQAAMNNMKEYADAGGRAFFSHYHNVWIVGEDGNPSHAPAVWPSIASCPSDGFPTGTGVIDTTNNPKGPSFSLWMQYVMASPFPGQFPITDARQTCTSVNPMKAEQWVHLQTGATQVLQNFQFTTPNEMPENARCGKVVFSDMHVASGSSSSSGTPFPNGCSTQPMTPQEKALAFMFFDIASCVGVIQ
jgi:hypothetical protein